MKTLQVGEVVGDYTVIGVAGAGGMGTVYKIEHRITRRVEAMKLLPAGLSIDPEQVHRFEREIQVQARLHHPNIVALYNAIRESDTIALVMEFVEGDPLQRLVAAGPLPVETAVKFAVQVLHALAYAHQSGVIHRDVSPANIIVTPELVAMLSDFGLALGATDLRLSTTGVALGSPWYMSPEQVRGLQKLDARTDLYAMGAVLHEMLTGRKMFEAEGSFAVMRAHVEAVPRSPSSLNPSVPPALDAIVAKAVAKDPAMRFQTADEFRAALERGCLDDLGDDLRAVPPQLRRLHISRGAGLMMLVPAVLAAAFVAGRFSAPAKPTLPPRSMPAVSAVSKPDTDRPSPVAPAPTAPEAPPAATATPILAAVPRPRSPVTPSRRPVPTQPDTALRITSAEPQPPAPPPVAAKPEPAPAVEIIEAAAPEPAAPLTEATPNEPAAPPAASPANPDTTGNRLVRALGKVNPFRRKKNEPSKQQLRKN